MVAVGIDPVTEQLISRGQDRGALSGRRSQLDLAPATARQQGTEGSGRVPRSSMNETGRSEYVRAGIPLHTPEVTPQLSMYSRATYASCISPQPTCAAGREAPLRRGFCFSRSETERPTRSAAGGESAGRQ